MALRSRPAPCPRLPDRRSRSPPIPHPAVQRSPVHSAAASRRSVRFRSTRQLPRSSVRFVGLAVSAKARSARAPSACCAARGFVLAAPEPALWERGPTTLSGFVLLARWPVAATLPVQSNAKALSCRRRRNARSVRRRSGGARSASPTRRHRHVQDPAGAVRRPRCGWKEQPASRSLTRSRAYKLRPGSVPRASSARSRSRFASGAKYQSRSTLKFAEFDGARQRGHPHRAPRFGGQTRPAQGGPGESKVRAGHLLEWNRESPSSSSHRPTVAALPSSQLNGLQVRTVGQAWPEVNWLHSPSTPASRSSPYTCPKLEAHHALPRALSRAPEE